MAGTWTSERFPQFEQAIRFAPKNALIVGNSHYFLGVIFTAMPGRLPDAIAHLREAVRMRPNDAASGGALDGALRARSTALTRKPPEERPDFH